ncbi:DUF1367 family protein [Variovorax sp. 278MFTsu5.1]|uniref:DUF1367 family protein n=1 Tax=Variovorax sp. 278MFTsu5.1 TaxID=3158366 RepID=UPI003AAD9743
MAKTPQGALMPIGPEANELLPKLKIGQQVWVDVVRARNTAFHRKWFSLVGLAFDNWEPPVIESGRFAGFQPEKDFDTFRKDITKLAGFVDVNVSITGHAIVTARSISFDKMEQDEFEKLYSATINVLLRLVFPRKTEAQLRAWVEAVMRYDG